MKNVSHKNSWNLGIVPVHVDPPPILLIKGKYYCKSDKYFVILKFCSYPSSSTLELYEFKMSLFDNGEPEEFCCLCVTAT